MQCPSCRYANADAATVCGLCGSVFRKSASGSRMEAVPPMPSGAPPAAPAPPAEGPFTWEFSRRRLEFPDACACCLGIPQDVVAVICRFQRSRDGVHPLFDFKPKEWETETWDFPVCKPCRHHIIWSLGSLGLGAAAVVVGAGLTALITGRTGAGEARVAAGLVVGLAVGGLTALILHLALVRTGPRCAGRWNPVKADAPGPFVGERFAFTFRNGGYGRRFAEVNR